MDSLGDYDSVQNLLESRSAELGAAEAHGLATGMLCANPNSTTLDWLEIVLEQRPDPIEAQSEPLVTLNELFLATAELMHSDQFGFDLFMPDDDAPLDQQASALGEWCQGFLFGLGCSGVTDTKQWPQDSQSILQDLTEIAKLDPSTDASEDEAVALTELREYIRVAVQVIMMELQTDQTAHSIH